MPCDIQANLNAQRRRAVDESLARLKRALAANTVKVVIDRATGALAFNGLWRRDGVADVCAYRALAAAGSIELRQAVARAEALAGRAVNPQAVAQGTHSHDGGSSWHAGH